MALRIELGAGQGRNWWCVIYPALCAPVPDMPLSVAADGAAGSAAREMGDGLRAGNASGMGDASGASDASVIGNASSDANSPNAGNASTPASAAHASDAPADEADAARGGIVFYSAIWDWLRGALGL